MKGKDPKKMMSKEDLQNPIKVQNLAPEPAKKCPRCNQELPGSDKGASQKSGKFSDAKEGEKCNLDRHPEPKMKHGQY